MVGQFLESDTFGEQTVGDRVEKGHLIKHPKLGGAKVDLGNMKVLTLLQVSICSTIRKGKF
jgi:hypothetical protein